MESGQLLLAVASDVLERIGSAGHGRRTRTLLSAGLDQLCQHCLVGVDLNPRALPATRAVFRLLGRTYGIDCDGPGRLDTADSMLSITEWSNSFDGIINNPPWGDRVALQQWMRISVQIGRANSSIDSYLAFLELMLRSLRPAGSFALALPAQFVSVSNAAFIRRLLLKESSLEYITILPQGCFGSASVRGVLLSGRKHGDAAPSSPQCRVKVFPLGCGPYDSALAQSKRVSVLALLRSKSWWPILHRTRNSPLSVPLGQVAQVFYGVKVYEVGRGEPPQSASTISERRYECNPSSPDAVRAVRGREVREFHVLETDRHIRFGRWIANIGSSPQLAGQERIYLRELCRRDGKMTAAIVKDHSVPLAGVYAIKPHAVRAPVLVAFLNSFCAAQVVRKSVACFAKVDFQKIVLAELREFPVPVALLKWSARRTLGRRGSGSGEDEIEPAIHRIACRLIRRSREEGVSLAPLWTELEGVLSRCYAPCT